MMEGQKAQKAGDQMEAVYDFLNAQRLDPTSPEPLYAEGMSFFLIGWDKNETSYYDRAARHFKAALELDPKYDRAAFMMAMMEVVHYRLEGAEPYFQRAIGLSPGNAYYHLYYGTLLERMDKHGAALDEMRLAEKLDPTYVQAYLTLGQLYAQKRQYQEARSQLERAVQLDSKRAEPYYTLGSVYHHLGMDAESQSSYRTFQQLKSAQPKPDPLAKAIQGSATPNSN
jgi:Flp pilus assembly protein TadD